MRTKFNIKSPGGMRTGILTSGLLMMLFVLAGCTRDESAGSIGLQQEELEFGAVVCGTENIETRARSNSYVYNVTTDYYGYADFYVTVSGMTESGEQRRESSIYEIPSGAAAMISPKTVIEDGVTTREKTLNWFSRTKEHLFWAWAANRDFYKYGTNKVKDDGNVEITFPGSSLNETTNSTANYWKSNGDDVTPVVWKNGEDLEQLIGAKAGPANYNSNGMYVPLQFRHLVSKIFLSTLYVIDNSTGISTSTLKGQITFYGLPDKATLYTTPLDDEGNPKAPYVAMPDDWDYDQTKGVTYAITNNTSYSTSSGKQYKWEGTTYYYAHDCWYICPEVDFSRISFKIEIYEYLNNEWVLSKTHSKHGAYYGDFKDISFSRSTTGSDYDDPLVNGQNPDKKILHAGEYIALTIHLSEKGNPAVKGTISDWSSTSRTGSSHVHQGIYGVEEMKDMSSIMKSGSEEDIREFYDLYGSGRDTSSDNKDEYPQYKDKNGNETELEIIELYDDIGNDSYQTSTTSTQVNKADGLNVADGYILDGNGHTVNCKSTSMSIGNVRDVYLRYYYYYSGSSSTPAYYTEYIVYIDKMGQVWLVDPVTFEMTPTEYNVNESGKNPMTISLSTGKIS